MVDTKEKDIELQKALDELRDLGLDVNFDEEVEKAEKEEEKEIPAEGEESEEEEEMKKGKKKDKDVKKSIEISDLFKSFETLLEKSNEGLMAKFEERLKGMAEQIESIGSAPMPRKSSNKLIKGEESNLGNGEVVEISWSKRKSDIMDIVAKKYDTAIEKGDSMNAEMYERELMTCTAGGGMLSKAMQADLLGNHNLKVIE